MRIAFLGSSSTGKTTMLEEIYPRFSDLTKVTEVTRDLSKKENLRLNEQSTDESQDLIFNSYAELLETYENQLSDRCILDPLVFTTWLYKNDKVHENIYKKQFVYTRKHIHNYDFLFYFPIKDFPLVKDDFRSEDEEFRKEIDLLFKEYIELFNIKVYEVPVASVEERKEFILNTIKESKKKKKRNIGIIVEGNEAYLKSGKLIAIYRSEEGKIYTTTKYSFMRKNQLIEAFKCKYFKCVEDIKELELLKEEN